MTSHAASANNEPLVSRNAAGAAIGRALRMRVGRGRRYSVKEVSNHTGVSDRAIECAMCDPDSGDWRRLPQEALLSLMSWFGPEFTSEVIAATGQGAYWLPDGEGDAASLNTDSAEFNFEYARATDPNGPGGPEIMPEERQRLRLIASRMAPKVQAVAA